MKVVTIKINNTKEQLNMAAILELRKIFDETGTSLSQEVINERTI